MNHHELLTCCLIVENYYLIISEVESFFSSWEKKALPSSDKKYQIQSNLDLRDLDLRDLDLRDFLPLTDFL